MLVTERKRRTGELLWISLGVRTGYGLYTGRPEWAFSGIT